MFRKARTMPSDSDTPAQGQTGSLAELLRAWRERALLTQQELAERSGVSERTVRRIEADGYRPYRASIRSLADALNLTDEERERLAAAAMGVDSADNAASTGPASTAPFPRQLPRDVTWFTGRDAEVHSVLAAATAPASALSESAVSAVVISAIDGMAGIGKTALAVHAGHRLAGQFPDGQIFLDLHGFTAGVAPVQPPEALDRLLRDVGIPGERIPDGLDERAALWRSLLAGRRMLIVLDNAASETQVQPLLPGSAGCLVLVTSRRRLAALDASHTVSLDTLPQPDAVRLFVHTADRPDLKAGTPESDAEPVEVVQLCGRLPLAIRIAAARLKQRRMWTVTDLVQRLRGLEARLAALDDGRRSVHATLHLSYQHLSAEAKRLYRRLGWHPGPEIEPYAAAALVDGSSLDEVQRWLDSLVDDHLLAEPAPGRYRFHDLVRAHAATTAAREETPSQQRAAVDRLLEHYRHTAAAAMDLAYPYERQRRPTVAPAGTPTPVLADRHQADRWLDTELANLLAAVHHAARHGWPEHTWHLSAILQRHLCTRGRYRDAVPLHQQALHLACRLGHHSAEMDAHISLGYVQRMLGGYELAGDHYRRALQIAQDIGDCLGELNALTGLGYIHQTLGRYTQAEAHLDRALQIAQTIGDRLGERTALTGLGHIHRMLDRYVQAGDHHGRALQIAQDIGDRVGELHTLIGLGAVHRMLGGFVQAGGHYRRALQIAQTIGDRVGEQHTLIGLGYVHLMQGGYERAGDHYARALQIAHAIGDRFGELTALYCIGHVHRMRGSHSQATSSYQQVFDLAGELGSSNGRFEALQGLGRLYHDTGHPDLALIHHEQALQYATDLAQPSDQARAHDGLAHAHHALDQHKLARQHWQHALDILTSLGTDRTEDIEASVPNIRAHLAETMPSD